MLWRVWGWVGCVGDVEGWWWGGVCIRWLKERGDLKGNIMGLGVRILWCLCEYEVDI